MTVPSEEVSSELTTGFRNPELHARSLAELDVARRGGAQARLSVGGVHFAADGGGAEALEGRRVHAREARRQRGG